MEDLSKSAIGALAATGQQQDGVSSPEHAMTAPGSTPAQQVDPSRADPPAPEVDATTGDYRHTVTGDRDGEALGRWTRAGGPAWGP